MNKKRKRSTPFSRARTTSIPRRIHATLSKKDIVLLHYICDQLTSEEIRIKLGKSKRTIENNRAKLLKKLDLKNTAGLVMYSIINKIVPLDRSLKAYAR